MAADYGSHGSAPEENCGRPFCRRSGFTRSGTCAGKSLQRIAKAKQEAAVLIDQANKRAAQIVEASKDDARKEGDKLIEQARAEIQQERVQARDALRKEVAVLAIAGAEKILETSVDAKAHSEMLDKLAAEL